METSRASYPDLLQHFLAMISGTSPAAEQFEDAGGMPAEILIQAIWRGQFLQADQLRTADGQVVEILDPGRHQTGGPGPDFRGAQILLGGQPTVGDIEIHGDAADWRHHGHDRDFEYNGVVLHVALSGRDHEPFDTLQNGKPLPRLLLERCLDPDLPGALASARELLLADSAGQEPVSGTASHGCRLAVQHMGMPAVRTFLARASDERMMRKVQRLRTLGRGATPDQILHQALLSGLGQHSAKTLYFLLARRAPVEDLMYAVRNLDPEDYAPAIESILLGVAGLLPPEEIPRNEMSESEAIHRATVRTWWARYRGQFADRVLPATRRWYGEVRPPGFPCRRLAAYSVLLASSPTPGLPGALMLQRIRSLEKQRPTTAKEWRSAALGLGRWMVVNLHPYWDRHCSWGGKSLPKAIALIGEDQADTLAYNALLPWALMMAEDGGDSGLVAFLRDLQNQFPCLPTNKITRHMEQRLFGGKAPPEIPLKLERYRQGLIQIFADCCDHPAFGECALTPPQ